MENLEALVLKKISYKESDYIVTFFTKEIGKISGIARNAKSSKKRFGGRLELFNHLKINIKQNDNKFNVLNDVDIKRSYSGIMEKLETFIIASFIMEHIDFFSSENEPSEELFSETLKTLHELENGENLLPKLHTFQLNALTISGYVPHLESENEVFANFSISDGKFLDPHEKTDNNMYKFYVDIIKNPEIMDIFLGKVANNVRVLTKYIEYHTGKQFKTSKFLEDLNL